MNGDLAHDTRRMLQALDAYWSLYDGGGSRRNYRHPYYDSLEEHWWTKFERYRARVEAALPTAVDEPPSEPDGKPSVAHDPGHEKARAETAASGSLEGGTAGAVPGSGDETA